MGVCTNYCNRCVGDDKTQVTTDQNQLRVRGPNEYGMEGETAPPLMHSDTIGLKHNVPSGNMANGNFGHNFEQF